MYGTLLHFIVNAVYAAVERLQKNCISCMTVTLITVNPLLEAPGFY